MKQIGVIGASRCDAEIYEIAYEVGRLIARRGYILINGGLGGVMEASAKGAMDEGGLVIGVIPYSDKNLANEYCTAVIATNMGHARNMIIVHSSDALIAVDGGYGTVSEMAIALKEGKRVVAIKPKVILDGLLVAENAEQAVDMISD
ncbi:TIGR00725 family protein [Archaeoglobus sulfaticallidus PM70-1]|uniref:TIGR00725 family protein n=1 Tax=Archaeoglobus sulfaticallidus PM70-1 TaxID=387631 RepID=N0BHD1_9EURY|nr:TIGR00725 family protein [Archaeoglobus sulfaticallidus]AGK61727.1 TIGR00725 family protein [Archaeoglobus sulfaticallidus PM70-1]